VTGHRTRLGIPARPGWLVREQVELAPPDGSLHVVAYSEPVHDATTADFAAGYGRLFAEHLPGYEEIDVRDAQLFGGRPAVLRRYGQVPADGAPLTQVSAYLVEGGVGHVVTATTTTSRFASVEGELLGLLAQFDLDRSAAIERPPVAVPMPRGDDQGTPFPTWTTKVTKSKGSTPAGVPLSADELMALARLLGHDRFPFLDEADAADATGESSAAVLRAALRSLSARGLVATSADGALVVQDELRDAARVALDPPLVVTVEVEAEGRTLVGLAVDAERCTEIVHDGAGVYEVRAGEAQVLLQRVAHLARAVDASAKVEGGSSTVPALAIDRARAFARTGDAAGAARELEDHPELRDALVGATCFSRVRTVHRADGAVHGGELVWLTAGDGTAWVLEPSSDGDGMATEVVARPIARDALYAELLGLLP
jgi:hypothetical protein